jgi:uncharacterized repeat protein (TIGR01451 family)
MLLRNWHRALRACTATLLVAVLFCASTAFAQQARNVLILTTGANEEAVATAFNTGDQGTLIPILNNIGPGTAGEFSTATLPAGSTVTLRDNLATNGSVTAATFVTGAGGRYDIVIVATILSRVGTGNWAAIQTAIQNHSADNFVFIIDGCCNSSIVYSAPTGNGNITALASLVGTVSPFVPGVGARQAITGNSPLITTSTYSASFTGLNPIAGSFYAPLTNVPANFRLYGHIPGATGTGANDAYGFIVPADRSNNGAGACVFGFNDASPFDPTRYPTNAGKFRTAILAAIGAGGSCRLAAITPRVISNGGTGSFSFGSGTNVLGTQNVTTTTAGVAVAGVRQIFRAQGAVATLTATLPANFITTAISCSNLPGGGIATPNLATNSVSFNTAAIAAGASIACTFTVQKTSRLRLIKTWVNATNGHQITATTSGGAASATVASTSTINNTTTGSYATLWSGDNISLPAETFTPPSAASAYITTLQCTGNSNALGSGAFPRNLVIAPADGDISCTYTNFGSRLAVTKTSATFVPNEFSLPGNDMLYTISVTNSGGVIDSGSIVVTDILPAEIDLYYGTGSPSPVTFTDGSGAAATGLICCSAANIAYLDAGGLVVSPTTGYASNVRQLRISPSGTMPSGLATPTSFQLSFRARIR